MWYVVSIALGLQYLSVTFQREGETDQDFLSSRYVHLVYNRWRILAETLSRYIQADIMSRTGGGMFNIGLGTVAIHAFHHRFYFRKKPQMIGLLGGTFLPYIWLGVGIGKLPSHWSLTTLTSLLAHVWVGVAKFADAKFPLLSSKWVYGRYAKMVEEQKVAYILLQIIHII
jgi:hypothetical protein